ncbi:PedC/BrcD family bacteriocin maturation disulfide isomerase [Levilactobacillus cerevisiae]|uniref:PedC/BrcD family bacteriocin maturation disulfide isomerase n=1 Tax=Levilactobacillus cerevisiae TaxID=1704076 RepID=UPI000F78BC9C|nr:PedC/BrcD family bacteriocin maturation disulfide isomerase [Levilactobacillus cerevisiae]
MKTLKNIILTALSLMIGGAFFFNSQAFADTSTTEPAPVSEEQYEENISGVTQMTGQEFLSKASDNSADFIVFFGFKECPYCREFSPTMKQYLAEGNHQVYYVNIDQFNFDTDAGTSLFNSVVSTSGIQFTPTIEHYKDGKIQQKLVGSDTTLEQLNELGS